MTASIKLDHLQVTDGEILTMTCLTCGATIEPDDRAPNPSSAAMQQCWVCRHVRLRAERDSKALAEEAAKMHDEVAA